LRKKRIITPADGTDLSRIIQWLKMSKKLAPPNAGTVSTDHLWGNRYFARPIKDTIDLHFIMNYID
jgi:putative transposase